MSVRAYKIIETADEPSFNLWYDKDFFALIEEVIGLSSLGDDCNGMLCIGEEELKEMQKIALEKQSEYSRKEFERLMEVFTKVKEDMGTEGYVNYSCY